MLSPNPLRLESFARVFLGSKRGIPAHLAQFARLRSFFLVGGAVLAVSPAQACCGFDGIGAPGFTGQTSLILWDSQKKVEHFLRRADFASKGKVAFLVATPTVPKFSVPTDEIWSILQTANTPPRGGVSGMGCSAGESMAAAAAAEGKGVTVLHEEELDGNQIVVLTATSAKAVSDYLIARKFKVYAEAEEWFQKYLKQGWVFTAIKSLPTAKGAPVRSTGEVLLSFKTDRPFHPYYVPKANAPTQRGEGLHAYYVSDEAFPQHADLPGIKEQGYRLSPENRLAIADSLKIPMTDLPANLMTAVYRDQAFPRVGPTKANPSAPKAWKEDLFFPAATKQDQERVQPSVEDLRENQRRLLLIINWTPFVLLATFLFLIGRGVFRFVKGRRA